MTKEQKFYSLLQGLFIGAKLEGDSGYVNLMNIKTDYFNKISEKIKAEVKKKFSNDSPEDLYEKLYTFFDSYFSDGGAIFFSSTPDYKNIYTKVYNPREDVSLFWKTSKLYYVKSEASYRTIENLQLPAESEVVFDFHFDASLLKLKQANEKKELEFYFTGVKTREGKKVIKFNVIYKNDNAIKSLKEILKVSDTTKAIQYVFEKQDKLGSKIVCKAEGLDLKKINEKGGKDFAKADLLVQEDKDLLGGVIVFIAITEPVEIEKYLRLKGIALTSEYIEKAYKIYKKQTEIDFFIHKDAKGFLREQFDLYVYEHLLGQNNLQSIFNQEDLDREKKVKEIAYLAIDYIGKFEDELKKIWLKPKFVRNSNYVVTLDRLIDKKGGMEVIEKVLEHKGIKEQITEWQELGIVDKKFNQKLIIKNKKLNEDSEKLPIDTRYFKDLELEIIGLFDNLDDELDGRLIKSENFQALNTLLPKYKEQVQTIYIDPPFNLEKTPDYEYLVNYKDSTWATLLENRFEIARALLRYQGGIFVRCDDNGNYLVRFLMDAEWGKDNFRNEIDIKRNQSLPKTGDKNLTEETENLFVYSSSSNLSFIPILIDREPIWVDLGTRPSDREHNDSRSVNGKEFYPPKFRRWAYSQENLDSMVQRGRAKVEGNNIKILLDKRNVGSNWTDIPGYSSNPVWGFSTENHEKLIKRVIETMPEKGIFLDYFLGIGTSVSVAHKLNNKWLGVEVGEHFYEFKDKNGISSGILVRMKEVLAGRGNHEPYGISKDIKWKGGGFLKYYELEQYEDALKKAVYNPTKEALENIDFSLSEKQAKVALNVDLKREKAKFVFEKLYSDVDIPETISNLFGKKIKKITKDKVFFVDDSEVDLNNVDFDKYDSLKKLIYW